MNSSVADSSRPSRQAKIIAMEKIKRIIEFEEEDEVEDNLPAIVADMSSSEDNNIDSAHPSTPKHQPTKPASTNAPERIPNLTIEAPEIKCRGCLEEQFNQLAHVGVGGCLTAEEYADRYANDYEYDRVHAESHDDTEYKCPLGNVGNDSYKCPCYVDECPGDCGTLWCGCIDVCRGRCGIREYEHGMWR